MCAAPINEDFRICANRYAEKGRSKKTNVSAPETSRRDGKQVARLWNAKQVELQPLVCLDIHGWLHELKW